MSDENQIDTTEAQTLKQGLGNVPDYSLDREEALSEWTTLVNYSDTLGGQVKSLFEACTSLPKSEVQIPVLTGFAMLPTAIVNVAPIAVAQGQSGTGKSDLGLIIAEMYNASVLSANTTYAALRNHIKQHKYYDPQECLYEKHFCVVFDDLGMSTIQHNEALFNLLKTGYNRKTSLTKIAVPGGELLEFDTFSTKFLTSIHAFWDEPALLELKRRSIIFKTARTEFKGVDPKEIDFSGLSLVLDRFWRDTEVRGVFKRRLAKIKHPHRELLASMSTVLNMSISEAKEVFDEFESFTFSNVIGDPMLEFIQHKINSMGLRKLYTQNIRLIIKEASDLGIADKCSIKDFGQMLKLLGWTFQKDKNQWFWIKKEK